MGGEVEAICDEAAAATGLDDFGDDWFLEPLRAWAEDLAQDTLTERGRRILRGLAVRDVARRLRVVATWRAHPEIAEVPLPPILYVTGLERSGTTLLHNLLALHPDARALLRWELMEPVPPPEAATHATDERIAGVQASVDRQRGTLLERMHWVNAREPEECVWGYIDAVSMLGQSPIIWMPSWWRVLREADLTTVFAHYRQLVQTLLWKRPVPPGGFLVLKAPQIGHAIATLAAALPEARFVVTDRDPFRCVTSMTVLGEVIAEPFCTASPMEDDGHGRRFAVAAVSPKLAAIAAFTTEASERIVHVPYPQLVAQPVATATSVIAGAGFRPVDLTPAIEAFLDRQRSGERVAPPGELGSMGYTRADVWAEPEIGEYCERFGIEPEVTLLTVASPPPS